MISLKQMILMLCFIVSGVSCHANGEAGTEKAVEAVKEQQREIEALRQTLEESGLMKKQ